MIVEHPLELILRDAKLLADGKAAALAAKQSSAAELEARVREAWAESKAQLGIEIVRANAVLDRHSIPESYTLRDIVEIGAGVVERCSLALGMPAKPPRAEYDLSVFAADGRITLFHRASGQRHQKLSVLDVSSKDWEAALIRLYEDHLKKARDQDMQSQLPDKSPPARKK